MSQNFETQGANGTESNGLNLFLWIKRTLEQALGFLLPQAVLISSLKPISNLFYSYVQ